MVSTERNKQLARRVFEEYWNKHDADAAPGLYTTDFTLDDPHVRISSMGLTATNSYFEAFEKAFPDVRFTVEEQVAEGDVVVSRLTATGTHEGELLGVPATHAKVTVSAVVFHRFEDGRIASALVLWDAFGFLRAAGALAPGGAMKPTYAKH